MILGDAPIVVRMLSECCPIVVRIVNGKANISTNRLKSLPSSISRFRDFWIEYKPFKPLIFFFSHPMVTFLKSGVVLGKPTPPPLPPQYFT